MSERLAIAVRMRLIELEVLTCFFVALKHPWLNFPLSDSLIPKISVCLPHSTFNYKGIYELLRNGIYFSL